MFERFRGILHLDEDEASMPLLRPNELRREIVREERQRREAQQPGRVQDTPPTPPLDRREQRPPPAAPAARSRAPRRPLAALRSPEKLREAILLKEILGPPRSLRGPNRDA